MERPQADPGCNGRRAVPDSADDLGVSTNPFDRRLAATDAIDRELAAGLVPRFSFVRTAQPQL